jgi:outer membrane biosynthesis protein TonB
VQSNNPFAKPHGMSASSRRRGIYLSAGIHTGVFLLLVLAGLIAGDRETVPSGGGEFVSVEMVFFDAEVVAADVVPVHEETVEQVEEVQEEVTEVVDELPVQEEQPVPEEAELPEPTEEVQEETIPPVEAEFIGVGSEGEAGSGAPGPASYEGRVFSSIRRNFRTSVSPARSYRITFTVNTDGTHLYEVLRTSGDSSFDRAVTHALNSASIPPIPPGRTSPVSLQIEFFGPDS